MYFVAGGGEMGGDLLVDFMDVLLFVLFAFVLGRGHLVGILSNRPDAIFDSAWCR